MLRLFHYTVWGLRHAKWIRHQLTHPNDYLLATMQHSGTHWLKLMLAKAIVDYYGLDYTIDSIQPTGIVPSFIDFKQHQTYHYNSWTSIPRVQHTHKPFRSPWCHLFKNKKVILLVRDLRDALVSHYQKHEASLPHESFAEFLRDNSLDRSQTVAGTLEARVEFLNSWYQNLYDVQDCLIVRYEDLKSSTETELGRILEYLGLKDWEDGLIHNVVSFTSIDNMRELNHQSFRYSSEDNRSNPDDLKVVNKGSTNRHKELFSSEDYQYFNDYVNQYLIHSFGYDYSQD